jgi:hypothetical protein
MNFTKTCARLSNLSRDVSPCRHKRIQMSLRRVIVSTEGARSSNSLLPLPQSAVVDEFAKIRAGPVEYETDTSIPASFMRNTIGPKTSLNFRNVSVAYACTQVQTSSRSELRIPRMDDSGATQLTYSLSHFSRQRRVPKSTRPLPKWIVPRGCVLP